MSRESGHSWSARTKAQSHAREAIEAVDGGVAPVNDFLLHPTTCMDIATTTVHNLLIVRHEPLLVKQLMASLCCKSPYWPQYLLAFAG